MTTRWPPTSWPDPEPAPGRPKCDDVTRLNQTEVEAVYCVRNRADVQRVLALARAAGRTVSMRGARHTMGGQTLTPGGIVIDMVKLAHMELDSGSGLLTVGPGALWSDVLLHLNQYGRSPRTMQSYSTFSVGGSISVNAHGITSDFCMAEGVVAIELVGWDGRVHTCARDAATAEGRELFGAVIGGYGMFGVMTSVTLKTNVNTPLTMEHVLTTSAEEFARVYSSLRGGDVEVKLCRLQLQDLERVDVYAFRRSAPEGVGTVSDIGLRPHEMSRTMQILYKWLLPSAQVRVRVGVGVGVGVRARARARARARKSARVMARARVRVGARVRVSVRVRVS
jgi:hypothetical protein